MLFNSAVFLFLFMPVTVVGYFALGGLSPVLAASWLTAASFFFYAYWNPPYILLLVASISVNYTFGHLIRRFSEWPALQSVALAIAVTANLLVLVYYKYLFPLLGWFDTLGLHVPHSVNSVLLPLGISFFTFTQIGYLVDCRAGSIEKHDPLSYTLFVTFFPHLIAGPILHHREVMPQFGRPATYRLNPDDVSNGFVLFVIGLAKKRFADYLAPAASIIFDHPHDVAMPLAWLGALSYSLQLYFDFSGYSDMAVGLARMFGIRFPINFNSPYKSQSIIDFWQQWHITLMRFLTSYVYNPAVMWVTRRRMARGQPVSRRAAATLTGFTTMLALPTLYTMTLAGIWHGAGWQFLIFGILHGCYLTINHAWRIFGPRNEAPKSRVVAREILVFNVLLTYLAVLVSEVLFRAPAVPDALQLMYGMIGLNGISVDTALMGLISTNSIGFVIGGLVIVWAMPNSNEIVAWYERLALPRPMVGFCYAAAAFVVLICASGPPVQFLYFQF